MVCVALFWLVRALDVAAAARARPAAAPGHVRRRAGGRDRAGGDHADPVRRAALALDRHRRAHGGGLGRARAGALPARDLPARLVGAGVARAARVRLGAGGARLLRGGPAADAGGLRAGARAAPRADRRGRRSGAVALAVATGIPPFFDIVKSLPGFDAARNGRLAVIAVLCVAVLAGWALDDLTGPEAAAAQRRRRLVLAVCGCPGGPAGRVGRAPASTPARSATGCASPGGSPRPGAGRRRDPDGLAARVAAAGGAGARCSSGCGCAGGSASPAFAALALALVVLDLFKAGMGYNPAIHERDAVQPATPAIRYLQAQRPNRFAGLHPEAPITLAVPIPPNVAMRYGLYDARGYDFPFEKRYAELWRRAIAQSPDCNYAFCPESAGRSPTALQGARAAGRDRPAPEPRRPAAARASSVAYSGPDARVYRNPAALPRAFLVGQPAGGRRRRRGARRRDGGGFPGAHDRRGRAAHRGHRRAATRLGRRRRARIARYGERARRRRHGRLAPVAPRPHRQLVPGLEGDGRRPRRADRARRLPDPRRGGAGGRPPGASSATSRRAGAPAGSSACSR